MSALAITKGPRETYAAYVARKLRAATRQGLKIAPIVGRDGVDVYADTDAGLKLLVILSDRREATALFKRVGADVPGFRS